MSDLFDKYREPLLCNRCGTQPAARIPNFPGFCADCAHREFKDETTYRPQPAKMLAQPTRVQTEDEKARKPIMRQRVYDAFQEAEKHTLRSRQLANINYRFSAPLSELTERGHIIKRVPDPDDSARWIYSWHGWVPVYPTGNGWQQAYYESEHWQHRSEARRRIDQHRCALCQQANQVLDVHHWIYELFDERMAQLMTMCREHHSWIHTIIKVKFPRFVTAKIFNRIPNWMDLIPDGWDDTSPCI